MPADCNLLHTGIILYKYTKACALAHTRAERDAARQWLPFARVRIHSGAFFLIRQEMKFPTV